jgi:hypothetical protein
MTFVAINTALKSILDTVRDASGSVLAATFDYEVSYTDEDGTPYACIVNRGAEETALDSCSNQTLYKFSIRVIAVNKDKSLMESTMRTLADDILGELRKRVHLTLGGIVDRVLPFVVTWHWDNGQQVPLRYFEIEVSVLKNFAI